MSSRGLLVGLSLACGLAAVFGCAGGSTVQAPCPGTFTQQDVIYLSRQGVPASGILERIDQTGAVFYLHAADVSRMMVAGVCNEVIDHMMDTCLQEAWRRSSKPLWYRPGQFYAPPPFGLNQGAYHFGE
ncbi:MAG: hypothetical protein V2A77_02320 [Pseudomonadota bacterium]